MSMPREFAAAPCSYRTIRIHGHVGQGRWPGSIFGRIVGFMACFFLFEIFNILVRDSLESSPF